MRSLALCQHHHGKHNAEKYNVDALLFDVRCIFSLGHFAAQTNPLACDTSDDVDCGWLDSVFVCVCAQKTVRYAGFGSTPITKARLVHGMASIDWGRCFTAIPSLKRPLRVAMPCVGVDGCGTALSAMKVKFVACNVYDLDERYKGYLEDHLKGRHDGLFLGKTKGDLTKVNLGELKMPIDILCSGPPCPPWAGNGCKKGAEDARADVFVSVVKWTVHAIKYGGLIAVVLENVKGVLQSIGGEPSFINQMVETLKTEVPEFNWGIEVAFVLAFHFFSIPHHFSA